MDVAELTGGALERAMFELLRSRLIRTVLVATPLPGADWSTAVPEGFFWRVQSVSARFTASAVAGNRQVGLLLADATATWARIGPAGNDTASAANDHTWMRGFGTTNSINGADGFDLPFPNVILPAGTTISTSTTGKDVLDQWDRIVLNVVEYSARKVLLAAEWLEDHFR